MNLDLNNRQRAMLLEMGVHVWWPGPVVQNATKDVAVNARPSRATADNDTLLSGTVQMPVRLAGPRKKASSSEQAALPSLPEGIASMDWPALGEAVAQCQACALCEGRRSPVLAVPPVGLHAHWLMLGDPPDEPQERAGLPFVDDAGKLLDRMLHAVGVSRIQPGVVTEPCQTAYLTHVVKCRPASMRVPNADELAVCAHYLHREIALIQPRVIVAMGRFAMQLVLCETPPESARLPLGKLRGKVYRYQGVPVVLTYPPVYLLRSGHDKARAWADLCLAQDVVSRKL